MVLVARGGVPPHLAPRAHEDPAIPPRRVFVASGRRDGWCRGAPPGRPGVQGGGRAPRGPVRGSLLSGPPARPVPRGPAAGTARTPPLGPEPTCRMSRRARGRSGGAL